MNLLFHFRTRGTGAEGVHIAGMANAFASLGHRVVFSNPTGVDPRETAGGSPFHEAGGGGFVARLSRKLPSFLFEILELGYNVPAFFRNLSILRREKCELIYERHAFFLFSTALLARLCHVPLVVEVNELAGEERVRAQPLLTPLAAWFDRFVFRTAMVIVVVSPSLKRRIEKAGIDGEKIRVLPNAVALAEFATPADGRKVRRRFGLEEAVVLGFVGWFVPWHRLDRLVERFAEIASSHARARLLLVGEGQLRAKIERRCGELGIADRVIFAGAVPHAAIPAHIAAMDVCVVPHSNEYRSPIKLFEYMGQGRAVVAPRTEPIEMVITDGVNGLLFDPGAESLREQLEKAIESEALRFRLGSCARADVLTNHTWNKNAQAVMECLSRS